MARKRLTINGLANLVDMPMSTLTGKFYGKTEFDLDEAIKVKKALGVDISIEELFQREEETDD